MKEKSIGNFVHSREDHRYSKWIWKRSHHHVSEFLKRSSDRFPFMAGLEPFRLLVSAMFVGENERSSIANSFQLFRNFAVDTLTAG